MGSKESSGIAIACLVLCVAGCGDPEPIAAGPTTACGTDGVLVTEIYGKSNVSFTDLTFTGHVTWSVPK